MIDKQNRESEKMPGFFYYPGNAEGLVKLTNQERFDLLENQGNRMVSFYRTDPEFETDLVCSCDNARIPTHRKPEAVMPGLWDVPFDLTEPRPRRTKDIEEGLLRGALGIDEITMSTEMKHVPAGDIGRGLTEEARIRFHHIQNPHLDQFGKAMLADEEKQTLKEVIILIFEESNRGQVISKEEAEGRRRNHPNGQVISHTFWVGDEKKWYFFSNDHCLGLDTFQHVVPCSSYLPSKIVAREGFEDGLIKTVDEMIRLYHPDDIYISSLEELVDVLIEYPQFIHKKLAERITELM